MRGLSRPRHGLPVIHEIGSNLRSVGDPVPDIQPRCPVDHGVVPTDFDFNEEVLSHRTVPKHVSRKTRDLGELLSRMNDYGVGSNATPAKMTVIREGHGSVVFAGEIEPDDRTTWSFGVGQPLGLDLHSQHVVSDLWADPTKAGADFPCAIQRRLYVGQNIPSSDFVHKIGSC